MSSQPATGDVLPDELTYLITSFLPSAEATAKSKAFLILSSYCQGVRSSTTDVNATERLARIFSRIISPRLGDTDETIILSGITLLTALFEVDWEAASQVFQEDGVLEVINDSVDLSPSSDLALSVALLFSQACARKSCRSILPEETLRWLENQTSQTTSPQLRVAASVALLKYTRGSSTDHAETGTQSTPSTSINEETLALAMVEIIVSKPPLDLLGNAVEALAYLTTNPNIKELLSKNELFLKSLFSFAPNRKSQPSSSTVYYGILVIVSNICRYPPQLSEEQAQVDKLRRMAKPSKASSGDTTSPLDKQDAVKTRCRRLVAAGVLEIFSAAASEGASPGIKLSTAHSLLSVIEDANNRGKTLQSGGAKVLISIIRQTASSNPKQAPFLEAIQALAKLAITSAPVQVFGPSEGVMYDAVRPFSQMVQHPSASLLQRFEGIMALTNLASHSPEVATRVAASDGLLNKVELLLLEEHTLMRRASMELITNLIAGSDSVFRRYSAQDGGGSSKLQILVAMSDVDDLQTRLAASGALATVTSVPEACDALLALQKERHRAFIILSQLIDPSAGDSDDSHGEGHPGLVHRGVVVFRNLCAMEGKEQINDLRTEAKASGLIEVVAKLVQMKGIDQNILVPALESLSILLRT